jgi:hypothetical protein
MEHVSAAPENKCGSSWGDGGGGTRSVNAMNPNQWSLLAVWVEEHCRVRSHGKAGKKEIGSHSLAFLQVGLPNL